MSEVTTPTTPRAPMEHALLQQSNQPREEPGSMTPTRDSFASHGKRALPISPFSAKFPPNPLTTNPDLQPDNHRDDSKRPTSSQDSQDIDMAGSDDGEDVSDTESNDDESGRPSKKKKKGQRFFCTDYPPCNLSFTRSEHLARHIRYVAMHRRICCGTKLLLENIRERGPSSATAKEDFRVLIIYDSTLRPSMSMRTYQTTRSLPLGLGSRGRSGQIVLGRLVQGQGHLLRVVRDLTEGAMPEICRRQASLQPPPPCQPCRQCQISAGNIISGALSP